jgi:hypothetical protein
MMVTPASIVSEVGEGVGGEEHDGAHQVLELVGVTGPDTGLHLARNSGFDRAGIAHPASSTAERN